MGTFFFIFMFFAAAASNASESTKYQCAVYKTYFIADPDLCEDLCTIQSGPLQVVSLEYNGIGGYLYSTNRGRAQYVVELKGQNEVVLNFTYYGTGIMGLQDKKQTFNTQKESVSISFDPTRFTSEDSKAGKLAEVKLVCGP